jgi:hypothetical protein
VRQAGAEHVAFVIDEDLGLVLEAAKCRRVNNPIAITLESPAHGRFRFFMKSSTAAVVGCRVGL